MSTNCQQVYVRALQASPANRDLVPIPSEVLARIEADQQALFASVATVTRDRFQTVTTITSNSAGGGRVIDLTAVTPPIERILTVTLGDGRTARQVDVIDINAELSPRYIVRGKSLVEIGSDWSVTPGVVAVAICYVYGPVTLSPSGDYTQAISVPDEWADLLVLPLQMYFASQRPATSETEYSTLSTRLDDRMKAFVSYLTNYGGIKAGRFDIPTPSVADKK